MPGPKSAFHVPVAVVPDRMMEYAVVVAIPVPPLPTGRVPVTPVVRGSPVQLVSVPDEGVPKTGVTSVGDVAKTRAPDPVSFVTAAAKLALVGVARNVATPVPRPETPVEIGRPVQLVSVPLAGVPRAGVVSVGLVSVLFVRVCAFAKKTSVSDDPAMSGMVTVAAPVV